MKIAIADANIFIDLIYIELLKELFNLDLELHTTIHVYEELNSEQQNSILKYVNKNKLTIHADQDGDIVENIQMRKGLSESDISVLRMAGKLNAFLLTGDGLLRKVSGLNKIEVHGVFWLLDNFLNEELISKRKASQCLKKLMGYNKRLPQNECQTRLSEWSK